ncbi:MAG: hypothetical protein ABIR62_04790 [Dokdonella sp.]|uniref:hypothetical protein n=1 Tax=Dokdonella sp. TaxID=2291710 RepID=UPI0032650551
MKRNNLTTAVVAGIAGVAGFAGLANAVDLNPDGLGQVLLYPYYTVNKGQDTLFSVVNTDAINGKAVKVRFLEGYNSREVLDFNLFLSPNDVWTARVSQLADDGGAAVFTTDKSCTTPKIPAGGQPFSAATYTGLSTTPFNVKDSGPQGITRTREGYLEIISMGDIIPGSDLSDAITHEDGVPPGCQTSVTIGNAPAADLVAPTGGLFGSGTIINVGEGTFFGYNADAVDGFTDRPLFFGSSALEPSLQQANTADLALGARAFVFINGKLLQADYDLGIDAVSAVFMSDALYNEYLVPAGLGANTDWIVTFPTKRFYVDPAFVAAVRAPFSERFLGGESNVAVGIDLYDQEEGTTTVEEGFSPPVGSRPSSLPYEVNVISFLTDTTTGAPSGVFGSLLRPNITPFGDAGWLRLGLNAAVEPHALPGGVTPSGVVTLNGLPATGHMGYNIINANAAPGKLANYGGLFRHRASRSCTSTGDLDAACS